jgi:hypothetical protein
VKRKLRPAGRVAWIVGCGLAAAWAGCAPSWPPKSAAGPDEQYTVAVDTAAAAAKSALDVLRAERRAIARRDSKAAANHLATLRQRIAAQDEIAAEVRKMPHVARLKLTDPEIEEMVRDTTGRWSAIVGHYLDGLDLARLETAGDDRRATVLIPAKGRGGEARVRIRCVRADDATWRVSRIDFVPRRVASPATASAPAGPG